MSDWIYLDHHATTPCVPVVVEAMLPWFSEHFGNPHSPHVAGREAAEAMDQASREIAQRLSVDKDELLFTSGATESNNLAILGVCRHPRQKRRKIVILETEHPAVLDPFARLEQEGFDIHRLPVASQSDACPGLVDIDRMAEAIDEQTALVSVMWANNEIGVLQPIAEIARLCHEVGALFHTDATQAVGRVDVDIAATDVDLLSASAHKFYGPKGVGLLYVRQSGRRVRMRPLLEGGGQQHGLRSGTMNPPGVIGMAAALRFATADLASSNARLAMLRKRLWTTLQSRIDGIRLNGPPLSDHRLAGNLNVTFPDVEGETLMTSIPRLCCSSGAACSSVDPEASHVLVAIGLTESDARSSLRFGIGHGNTEAEIDRVAEWLVEAHQNLRHLK